MKSTRGAGIVGQGGQTFTICGDHGLILGVYVVPDTGLSWTKQATSEVVQRHKLVSCPLPKLLSQTARAATENQAHLKCMMTGLWRSLFKVKLDAMHLMLRIGREMNIRDAKRFLWT